MNNKNLEMINKFINENFEDSEFKAFNNLEKLISFILDSKIIFNEEKETYDIIDIEMLIRNNDLFKKMISTVCIPENIDKLKSMNVYFVNLMIKAYKYHCLNSKETAETEEEYEEEYENLNNFDFYASSEEMDAIALFIKSIPSKLLSKEEVIKLYHEIENGNKAAFDELVTHNLRLVISVAKQYNNRGVDFLDLIQSGTEGLIRAVEKFDYKLGWKFSTYARWWIRQAITRSIANESRNVRIPVHISEHFYKIKKYSNEFFELYNRYPNTEEISKALNLSESRVEECIILMNVSVSLNQTVVGKGDEADETELQEFIADETASAERQQQLLFEQDFNYVLNNETNLTKRELEVIKFRFGYYGKKYTLEEVGENYGVTRERIRQIESKALRKLKKNKKIQQFRQF